MIPSGLGYIIFLVIYRILNFTVKKKKKKITKKAKNEYFLKTLLSVFTIILFNTGQEKYLACNPTNSIKVE